MNLKLTNFPAIALLTTLATTAIAMPATASSIVGSRLVVGNGAVRFMDTQSDRTLLDFAEYNSLQSPGTGNSELVKPSQGIFASFVGTPVTIRDVVLRSRGANLWELDASEPIENFILGSLSGDDFSFSLTKLTLERFIGATSTTYYAALDGIFNYRGQSYDTEEGDFVVLNSSRFMSGNGSGYLIGTTVIPSPALLPGLIGFGFAAWRKRKAGTTETES